MAAAQQGKEQGIRGGVAGSDSLYTGKARLMELKDDTDVRLWPSQPSVMGNWPSHRLAPSCRESGGRIVMTSHYELGAVFQHDQLPRVACVGVGKEHKHTGRPGYTMYVK